MAYKVFLMILAFWAKSLMVTSAPSGGPPADLVTWLPRVRFSYSFKQYAGYLDAGDGMKYFYWYMDSQSQTASTDPLIVWFSSYPGCSSLIGLLNELGPFRPNVDGYSLYENVFSWNKVANLLFIDSPAGVGWSYANNTKAPVPSDDQVATYNYNALRDFITKFSQYNSPSTKLYLAGEAYNGVSLPLLANKILGNVKNNQFPDILKGVAIGNGFLSALQQTNSMLHYFYHHGLIGTDTWDNIGKTCCSAAPSIEDCNFYKILTTNNPPDCAKLLNSTIQAVTVNTTMDPTNILHDCYNTNTAAPAPPRGPYNSDMQFLDGIGFFPPGVRKPNDKESEAKNAPWSSYDPAHSFNYDSTDALLGFTCWSNESKYLSQSDVMRALHVAPSFIGKQFVSCASNFQFNQSSAYLDMSTTITALLQTGKVKMLFYSGDLDMEFNFLGQEWFLDRSLAQTSRWQVIDQRGQWTYRGQTAGFVKRYNNVDEVTVKGAGRYVPMDRAGPALQMINNFLKNQAYSSPSNINVTPKPNSARAMKGLTFTTLGAGLMALFVNAVLSRL